MTRSTKLRFFPLFALLLLTLPGCSGKREGAVRRNVEESQALVLLRGLPTLGTVHSVAIVELDPDTANFGALLQEVELPKAFESAIEWHRTIMESDIARSYATLYACGRNRLSDMLVQMIERGQTYSDAEYRRALEGAAALGPGVHQLGPARLDQGNLAGGLGARRGRCRRHPTGAGRGGGRGCLADHAGRAGQRHTSAIEHGVQ